MRGHLLLFFFFTFLSFILSFLPSFFLASSLSFSLSFILSKKFFLPFSLDPFLKLLFALYIYLCLCESLIPAFVSWIRSIYIQPPPTNKPCLVSVVIVMKRERRRMRRKNEREYQREERILEREKMGVRDRQFEKKKKREDPPS